MADEEPEGADPTGTGTDGIIWAARDLAEVVDVGLERGRALLTAGELVVARTILALDPEARGLYARLLGRVGPVFRVSRLAYPMDVSGAVACLAAVGLVHTSVPPRLSIAAFDLDSLRASCRRLGLPTRGRRADLVARLEGRPWCEEVVVLPGHAALIARLELLYFERPWMDRQALLLERIEAVRWATYVPTGGHPLFIRRTALRTWERARAGDWTDVDEPLRLATAADPDDGSRFSARRYALQAVLDSGPRAGTLEVLLAAGEPVRPALALALEREGRAADALAVCRGQAPPADAIALDRTGARLARKLGRSWPPHVRRDAPTRVLRLARAPAAAPRPRWTVDGEAHPVEAAVLRTLARAGREGRWAENHLWTSLYAMAFADLYFLPLPGALPTPRRDGPVDVGTPAFAERRRDAIHKRLDELRGEGAARWAHAWTGERLAGLSAPALARELASRIPGPLVAEILGRLAWEGWSAASGLPDLILLEGDSVRVEGLLPGTIGTTTMLVEVKGEGDTLRDGQRVWHDRLLGSGVLVECWMVRGT